MEELYHLTVFQRETNEEGKNRQKLLKEGLSNLISIPYYIIFFHLT